MDPVASKIACYMKELCGHEDRHPGRPGNRAATALFKRVAETCGLEVETSELECIDVERGELTLEVGGDRFEFRPGPYSNGCDVTAALTEASTIEQLEAGGYEGSVLVLHGELCREQLRPRGYPFYEMPEHDRILDALEAARPAAVIAATGLNPMSSGAVSPFPLIEDTVVELPNACMTESEGERLLRRVGEAVAFKMECRRVVRSAEHVVARARGTESSRIVVCGHIDTKSGTPGALDNGTGAAALMGLAWLLSGYSGRHTVELVPFNGEDYYDATGERRYCADNAGRWGDIVLGLNADAAGWAGHETEVSMYGADDRMAEVVRSAMARRSGFVAGEPWFQSDHSIFVVNGRPAVAVTSSGLMELCATVTHTTGDTLDLVDPEKVADVARFYADVINGLS